MARRAVITGAFSYIGAAAARELRRRGWTVHTLTNRRTPPHSRHVTFAKLLFHPDHLAAELRGADVFVNTYWIRLPHAGDDFHTAVRNNRMLVDAAVRARVGRLVHVSVSNASLDSRLGYYRGKAEVDAAVRACGLPHAIVRPTLVVGPADVLTSNIAWFLRRFPVFPVPDGGGYRLQPVTLDDTGRIVADAAESSADLDVDAAGQDIVTFREYVELVARACHVKCAIIGAPGRLALAGIRLVELFLGDTVLAREELAGLEQELLVSRAPPLGTERVDAWLLAHGAALGRSYVNDRRRHFGDLASQPIASP
ncbi:MAG: NAD(P)H-binding protein [Deltaproteobacteria bacterium]|nr:NAD(P)H-binding protein [Deltaproteobacteria bacterium]